MNQELINALLEIAKAQNRIADQLGRLADTFTPTKDYSASDWQPNLADNLQSGINDIASSLSDIAEKTPFPPDPDSD